jgi:putative ATP-binding cassette transporter
LRGHAVNVMADDNIQRKQLVRRFWRSARGFWHTGQRGYAWPLTFGLIFVVACQVFIQYRINVWNRAIFDALEKKSGAEVLQQALLFGPLVLAGIFFAVAIVYARMTTQRNWRRWLTDHIIDRWLENGRYFHLNLVKGDHANPEYRIAEDTRIATESPVDFAVGLLSASLSAVTFMSVLWFVGGNLEIASGGGTITIPAYLVIAAVLYAVIASGSMAIIGRNYVKASEGKSQQEAELRYALTRVRENGESIALIAGEEEEKLGLDKKLKDVLQQWKNICRQYMRTTVVAQVSFMIAPVFPVILSAPKFLAGQMTLGQVMQAASAFVIVQTAFNWLVDNYPRFADWTASARRVASLMISLDALESAEKNESWGRIQRDTVDTKNAMLLKDVSVTLDSGKVVVKDAEVEIKPGERVLFEGESGSGKSTLVRAIAGLWPWGSGQISLQQNAEVVFLPQKPYIPVGPLRRAVIYPRQVEEVPTQEVKDALKSVGLPQLVERVDEDAPWDQTLSGGEKQRIAFARLLIHRPHIIVMDEATSALDKQSQKNLMNLVHEKLPETTIVSVGHREELEAFHDRKIVLEYNEGGARIISDENLPHTERPRPRILRVLLRRHRSKLPPLSVPERHPGDRLNKND